MDFDHLLDQAIEMLQRRGRLTYRTLKRQFDLDDETFEDLKEELVYGQRLARDEAERVLVWTGEPASTPSPAPVPQFRNHSPTPRNISRTRFSPLAVPWKGNASRSPSCLPTSKIPPS